MLIAACAILLAPLAAQTITVNSPNGGEYCVGGQVPIAWTKSGAMQATVTIALRFVGSAPDAAPALLIATGADNDQSYLWTIPASVAPGSYFIRVRTDDASVRGDGANFTILAGDCVASLTLTSPNGGEEWTTGATKEITWNAVHAAGPASLSLWQDGKLKGFIARHIPASWGKHEWIVGKLVEGQVGSSGMVDPGGHFRVRLVKEYAGNQAPANPLMDKSDADFSIISPSVVPAQGFPVSKPAENDVYEYVLNACVSTVGKCVMVLIQWTTGDPPPFAVELWDDAKKVKTLLTHNDPPAPGTKSYSIQSKFTPANSSPGIYRIVIRSVNGHSGSSGLFRLRHRAVEEKILPAYRNRRHWKAESYHDPSVDQPGNMTVFGDRPDWARTGFDYNYKTSGSYWWWSAHVFRSRLLFDLSRFNGHKGKVVEAKLCVDSREAHHSFGINMQEGESRVFVLVDSWENREFFDAPAQGVGVLPHQGSPGFVDLTEWVKDWVKGEKTHYGIMVTGSNEDMEEKEKHFCTYYKFSLRVLFRDE